MRRFLILFAVLQACADPNQVGQSLTGSATVSLTEAPNDARCLRVAVGGTRTVESRFDLIPGQRSTFSLSGLPLGIDTFAGFAYDIRCDAADDSATPTWLSDPVSAAVSAGVPAHIALVMHRNAGTANVSVDFEDDLLDGAVDSGGSLEAAVVCPSNRGNCDGNNANGCEVDLWVDGENCGGCRSSCQASQVCNSGTCANAEAAAVAVGHEHACSVINGAARCWGLNTDGQLGNNSTERSLVPVQVYGLASGVTDIAAGYSHTCAIVNGGAQCWGSAAGLGNRVTTSSLVPFQVEGLTSGVTAIAAADNHTCAVVHGGVRCWGWNNLGQLGDGSTTSTLVPVQVQGVTIGATAVAAGGLWVFYGDRSCAVVNGAVQCWGDNSDGDLGNNSKSDSLVPVQVYGLNSRVTAISAGHHHTCAIVNGGAQCWGAQGQTQSLVPVPIPELASGVTTIAAGNYSTCAIVDGGVRCWGANDYGELGNGTSVASATPVLVQNLTSGVQALALGGAGATVGGTGGHACAIVENGAQCWGYNKNGELGDGTTKNSSVPVKVRFDLISDAGVADAGVRDGAVVDAQTDAGSASVYVDISAGQGASSGQSPSALIDTANGKLLTIASNGSHKLGLFRCDRDGSNCTYTDISAGQPLKSGTSPSALIDAAHGKLLVVATNGSNGNRPSLFRCNLDGTECTHSDLSAGRPEESGLYPSAVIDPLGYKLLVVTEDGANAHKPGLFRCELDGTDCTFTDISAGQGAVLQPKALLDSSSGRLLVVTWNNSSDARSSLGLIRCNPDGADCQYTDIVASQNPRYATYPSAVIDPVYGDLVIVAQGQNLDNGGDINRSGPVLLRCKLDGTGCAYADLSGGRANLSTPSITIDGASGQLLVVTEVWGYDPTIALLRCSRDGSGCTYTDIGTGHPRTSISNGGSVLYDGAYRRLMVVANSGWTRPALLLVGL